ncbi:toll/interleukin-1 receptor domain-containing protein, partial [uncultured Maritimibacter sp.]|uniref:toll/interleukin-1 receptor domain-containing protein n=1 Tax=uncultured Maritimibacter sp. TaxID=991866 RepID=UPI002592B381
MAHIFISHSSKDAAAARRLKEWLSAQGFDSVFLDIDKEAGIQPGAMWERTLYRKVERCQAMLLVVTPDWLASQWCFAEYAQARALGKAIFPLIETPTGETFVGGDLQAIDLTEDREGKLTQLAAGLRKVALLSPDGFELPDGVAPYPGLTAFGEEHAAVYFGREDATGRLMEVLRRLRAGSGGSKLIALLGASGTGKSSLLRAGLLARLRREGSAWIVLPAIRAEATPARNLADAIAAATAPGDTAAQADLANALSGADPSAALADAARRMRRAAGALDATILIAIDQGEEVFTLAEPAAARAFLTLLNAAMAEDLPFLAVIAMRSDYLDALQAMGVLLREPEVVSPSPMPVERIGAVVRGPARLADITVDDDFVAAVTADAGRGDTGRGDTLPLVAFLLARIYETHGKADRHLSLADYDTFRDVSGGLSPLENAVRLVAEDALPASGEQARAANAALREAFVPALVRLSEEGEFTRRPAPLSTLPAAANPWIDLLVAARVLVRRTALDGEAEGSGMEGPEAPAREPVIEVAHEALFRVWPRLAGWLEEERDFLAGKTRLDQALADWTAQEDDIARAKALLTGVMLDRARDWLLAHPARFSGTERDFILRSEAAERIAQARTHRRDRLIRYLSASVAAVSLIAIGLVGWQWREAVAAQDAELLARRNAEASEADALAARDEAKAALGAATRAANTMIFDLAQEFEDRSVPTPIIRAILEQARTLQDTLAAGAPDDAALQRSRAVALNELGDVYARQDNLRAALDAYRESLDIARALTARDPDNTQWQRDVSISLDRIGDVTLRAGDASGALDAYRESLDIFRALTARDPDNTEWQRDVSVSLNKIGDVQLRAGDASGALDAYREGLDIARALAARDPDNTEWQRDVSISLDRIGDVTLRAGDASGALD